MYKAEVLNPSSNNSNDKYVGSMQGPFKKNITIIKVGSHMKDKAILSNYIWEIKNKFGIDPILKWEIVKKMEI